MNKNIKKLTKEYTDRHKLGQFFTSDSLVEYITKLFNISYNDKDILEPSFGGCAFVKYIVNNSKNPKITAVDIDKSLCNKHKNIYQDVDFVCSDFLAFDSNKEYDIVIGNPPFNLRTNYNYYDTTEGFLLKSLSLLKKNGSLYFVMPSTILRNKQYENLRKTIINNYEIKAIINTSKYEFLGADIETIVIYIKNKRVKEQSYVYYDGNYNKKVKLTKNNRHTILINNTDVFEQINEKLSDKTLNDVFDIHRGRSQNKNDLRGRDINFYGHFLNQNNGNDYFIGLQNIAYRLTCNLIYGDSDKACDTVTLLKPKGKIDNIKMCFISEFLNSSIANYLLHINCLNECRLTIHIDKYYIDDIHLPKYCKSFKNYVIKANSINNRRELGDERNKYFYKLLRLNNDEIKEIERLWTFPAFKEKINYKLNIENDGE